MKKEREGRREKFFSVFFSSKDRSFPKRGSGEKMEEKGLKTRLGERERERRKEKKKNNH